MLSWEFACLVGLRGRAFLTLTVEVVALLTDKGWGIQHRVGLCLGQQPIRMKAVYGGARVLRGSVVTLVTLVDTLVSGLGEQSCCRRAKGCLCKCWPRVQAAALPCRLLSCQWAGCSSGLSSLRTTPPHGDHVVLHLHCAVLGSVHCSPTLPTSSAVCSKGSKAHAMW